MLIKCKVPLDVAMDSLHRELVKLGYFKRPKPVNYNEELGFWMTTEGDKWICKNINNLSKIEVLEDFDIQICANGYKESLKDILTTKKNKNMWNSNFKEKRFINKKSLFRDKIFIDVKKYTTIINNEEIEKYLEKSVHKKYITYHDFCKEVYFKNLLKMEVIKSIKQLLSFKLNDNQLQGLFIVYYYFYEFDSFILTHLINLFDKNRGKYISVFKKILKRIKETANEEILENLLTTIFDNKEYLDLVRYIYGMKKDINILKLLSPYFIYNISMEFVSIKNFEEMFKIVLNSEVPFVLKQKFFRKVGKLINSQSHADISLRDKWFTGNNEILNIKNKKRRRKNIEHNDRENILINGENEEPYDYKVRGTLKNKRVKEITQEEIEKIVNLLFNRNMFIYAYNISYFKKLEKNYFKDLQFERDTEKSYFLNAIINQQIFHNNKIEVKRMNYNLLDIDNRRKYLKIMYLREEYTFIVENPLDFKVCLEKDLNFLKRFSTKSALINFCIKNKGIRIFDALLLYQKLPPNLLNEMSEVYIDMDTYMFYRIIKEMKHIENANTLILRIFSKTELQIEIFNILLKHTSLRERHYLQILYISLFSYKSNNKAVYIKMFKKLCKKINAQQIYAVLLNFLLKGIKKSIISISLSVLMIKHPHLLSTIIVDSFIKEIVLISVLKAIKYFDKKKYKKKIKILSTKLIPIIQHGILHKNKQITNIAIESICNTIQYYKFDTQQTFFNIFIEKFYTQKSFLKKYKKMCKILNEEILKPSLLTALHGSNKKRMKGLVLLEIYRKNFRKNKTFSEVFVEIFMFN